MTLLHALLLGIIQGLTEFIPVSSTAHVLIFGELLGIPADDKVFSFSVIVQLGTVVAMLAFFWKDIWHILVGFFQGLRNRKPFETLNARLGWLIILASIPALTAGFFLRDIVKTMFSDPFTQAGVRLLITAILLGLVEYFDKRTRTLESANWLDALSVGLFQVLAIFPGASRSGTTIAGGMIRGFDRPSAARFAFLMSSPVLVAAGMYESLQVINGPGTTAFVPYLIAGFITAAISGWFAIKWLIDYLSKRSLYVFAIYCAVVGITLLLIQWT